MRPISIKCTFCEQDHDIFGINRLKSLSGINEESVTDFNIKSKFDEFNKKYFDGAIPEIPITFSPLKSAGGKFQCVAKNNAVVPGTAKIVISSLFSRSEQSLDGVILHEMIHAFLAFSGLLKENHGPRFKSMQAKLSQASGIKIPLTDDSGMELSQSVPLKPLAVLVYKTSSGFAFAITTQKALTPEVLETLKARWTGRSTECWLYLVRDKDWSAASMQYPISRNLADCRRFFLKTSNNAFLFTELVKDGKLIFSNKNTTLVVEDKMDIRKSKAIVEDSEGATYYVTALTNDRARLIASETSTSEKEIADMVAAHLEQQGYKVLRRVIK